MGGRYAALCMLLCAVMATDAGAATFDAVYEQEAHCGGRGDCPDSFVARYTGGDGPDEVTYVVGAPAQSVTERVAAVTILGEGITTNTPDVCQAIGNVAACAAPLGDNRVPGGFIDAHAVLGGGDDRFTVIAGSHSIYLDTPILRVDLTGFVRVEGQGGNDTLTGGPFRESLDGGPGADVIRGDSGNDDLEGREDDDLIEGAHGDDHLDGGFGNDTLVGGPGDDVLLARDGDDVLDARDGERDSVICEDGQDTAYVDGQDFVSECEDVRFEDAPGS